MPDVLKTEAAEAGLVVCLRIGLGGLCVAWHGLVFNPHFLPS